MPLSGKEMLRLFLNAGWIVLRQNGSHVTLGNGTDRAVIPMHRELRKGTEHTLLKKLHPLGVKK